MKARALWLCWVVLVFGVFNLYGPSIEHFIRPSDPPSVSIQTLSDRTSFLDRIALDLRDDLSSRYYYSIAQATFGRPYPEKFLPPYANGGERKDDVRFREDPMVEADPKLYAPPAPMRPWRDFLLEYPPGMLAVILAPSILTSDMGAYFKIFSLEMELFLTLAVFLSVRTARHLGRDGVEVLSQAIILTAALGVVAVRRYDPAVAFAISATVYALAIRRPAVAGFAFAFAVALKGAPFALAPVLALWFTFRRDWKGLFGASTSFAIGLGVTAAAYMAIAGPRAFDAYAYHADRPIQIETIYSAALMILRYFAPDIMSIERSFGSYNIVSPYAPFLSRVATVAVLVGVIASYGWAFKSIRSMTDDRSRLVSVIFACCACLVALISLGKVSSPQYLVLLIPIGALAGALSKGDGRWRLVFACGFTQVFYPFLYPVVITGALTPLDGLLVAARQLALWRWTFKIATDPIVNLRAAGDGTAGATADVDSASRDARREIAASNANAA